MQINHFYDLVAEVIPPCYNQPNLFDPDIFIKEFPGQAEPDYKMRHEAKLLAKSLCAECPIQKECLEIALRNNETAMIWGGYTPDERAQMRKSIKTP